MAHFPVERLRAMSQCSLSRKINKTEMATQNRVAISVYRIEFQLNA